MTRILFVTSKSLGGSGKYISTLASALRERGYHCEIIYFPLGVAQDKEIEAAFAVTHHFRRAPGFSPVAVAANVNQVRRLVRSRAFDWVHSHTSLGGLFGRLGAALAFKGVHIGQTLHAFGADEFTPLAQKSVYWVIERFLDALTTAYVAPSRHMVAYGGRIRVITPRKATVIYNALQLPPPPANVLDLRTVQRQAWGLAPSDIVFLFCGRLEAQKGFDVLIAALALLPRDLPIHLLACGIGEDEVALRAQAEAAGLGGKITWAGWQSSLDAYYASADVYVMPSRWESFGLVFLEAMNYSLPIASTVTQAIPEVVLDGVTGLLSRNEDAEALAKNLLALATQPELRLRLGQAGKMRLEQTFPFSRFVEQHEKWYRSRD